MQIRASWVANPSQRAEQMSDRSASISNSSETDGIAIPELESLFRLYPNPANDYLSVEFINPNGACSFNIYSIKGELVKSISSNQQLGFISIDVSQLQSGNYIIDCPQLNSKQSFIIAR